MTSTNEHQAEQLGMKKEIFRHNLRVKRDTLTAELRREKSNAIIARALPKLQGAQVVAAYCAMRSELDPTGLIGALRARGCRIAFPRMVRNSRVLEFAQVDDLEQLELGPFQVLEPKRSTTLLSLASIDTFLVPGLSFDTSGNRIGYGKGYYDHTLAQNPGALRLGLCFQEQIATSVPRDATDQQMDWVVTDSESFAGPVRNRTTHPKVQS